MKSVFDEHWGVETAPDAKGNEILFVYSDTPAEEYAEDTPYKEFVAFDVPTERRAHLISAAPNFYRIAKGMKELIRVIERFLEQYVEVPAPDDKGDYATKCRLIATMMVINEELLEQAFAKAEGRQNEKEAKATANRIRPFIEALAKAAE